MSILYAISAHLGGRVSCNSNLSEIHIGWITKWGDVGDFAPLANLTSTEVIAVGKELGLPDVFINKPPADGLTNKTDEENWGFSYDILDNYIRNGACEDLKILEKIKTMHLHSIHKVLPIPKFVDYA